MLEPGANARRLELRRQCGPDVGAQVRQRPRTVAQEADGAMMFDRSTTCRALLVAAMMVVAVPMLATPVHAQQVVVIVNGDPITALDIEQRTKLTQLSTHKTPTRQEVLDELINERLKVREAKKWGLEVPSSEVDNAYASMAKRMQ